jgi:hypothetical protein
VVCGNRATERLEVVRKRRQCLHFYASLLDPEFGFMHIRLQSGFPFEIQVYVNGREWLARQLDQRQIAYSRYDNKLTQVADLKATRRLCERFAHRKWPRVLNAFARRVNPHLETLRRAGFSGYYWMTDQCEYATDVLFRDRASLATLYPSLVELSLIAFSAEDVLRFLGRKPHGNFQGEVTSNLKRRTEGRRVKHTLKQNSLKMYDPDRVLRVEATTPALALRASAVQVSTIRASSASCVWSTPRKAGSGGGARWAKAWPTSGAMPRSANRLRIATWKPWRLRNRKARPSLNSMICAGHACVTENAMPASNRSPLPIAPSSPLCWPANMP